jgi:enoyl-CoA hydratase/carnithine racemase
VSGGLVETSRDGSICVLTIRRGEKLNALSTEVERALAKALASDDVRGSAAVVIAGEGRAFSAGAVVSEFADRDPAAILAYYRDTGGVYEQVASLPQPTISAIHGWCLGGGLELALATDFRIADETAVLGFPELGLGILPSSGGTLRAVRLLGPARAKEVILIGGRLDARAAQAAGLLTEVVTEGRAVDRARELAAQLAEQSPVALAVAKQAIDAAAESSREAALLIERLAYGLLAQTPDARGSADAFRG